MDLSSIFGTIMSSEGISGIAAKTGASSLDIKNVLSSALPQFLSGADKQNTNEETSQGFVNALEHHAGNDTSNISSFFGNVDLADGAKIVGHLLGKDGSENVASETGVSSSSTSNILSSAAPMFMSLLGKQFGSEKKSMGTHIVDDTAKISGESTGNKESVLHSISGGQKTAVSGGVKAVKQSKRAQMMAKTASSSGPKEINRKNN